MLGGKWTAEDKIRIVLESLTTNITVAELCRKYNVNPAQYYVWKQRFIEGGKLALTSSRQENVNKDLAAENERLKRIIGEQTIVIDAFKKHWKQGGKALSQKCRDGMNRYWSIILGSVGITDEKNL